MSTLLLESSSKSWSAVRICRTPEKVTAAVATPRLLWGEKRRERMAAGERSQGRNRGKGAQLRRRLRRQQEGIDRWRVEEREARIMVGVAAAKKVAEERAVLVRAFAERRMLGKELHKEEQEMLRRQREAVDDFYVGLRVKRAESAVATAKAKAVETTVVVARAWAQEARARAESLLLREELRSEEKVEEKEEQDGEERDEEQDGATGERSEEKDEEQDGGGRCEEKEKEQDGGEDGAVQRGEERYRDEASWAVWEERWKRLSSEGLLPRLDSRFNGSREDIAVMMEAAGKESERRRVEKEMRQRGERRGGGNQ
jgi:hypothetical protein